MCHSLNVYEDHTVDANTVRHQVMCFRSNNSRSALLVQTAMRVAHRLLFMAGEEL